MVFAERILQAARRDVQRGEAPPSDESNVSFPALRSAVQKLACLLVATEADQRLRGADGCAASKIEVTASCGAPEELQRSLGIAGIERIGARVDQAARLFVADRPVGAQEFL